MADNTTLSTGAGGDVIRTDERIDRSTGTEVAVKTQVIKLAVGRAGVELGIVDGEFTSLPVSDARMHALLEEQNALLRELVELIKNI